MSTREERKEVDKELQGAGFKTLENLNFDNLALRSLPVDKEQRNYVRIVRGACFSLVNPTPVRNPQTVAVAPSTLALLDLSPDEAKRPDFAEYFSGNTVIPGARPAAHCKLRVVAGAFRQPKQGHQTPLLCCVPVLVVA